MTAAAAAAAAAETEVALLICTFNNSDIHLGCCSVHHQAPKTQDIINSTYRKASECWNSSLLSR
jgi:hypothetical protein